MRFFNIGRLTIGAARGDLMNLYIFCDGAARGNPGPSGAGAVLKDERGRIVAEVVAYLGDSRTNNEAEYEALILALEKARELGATGVFCRADSKLVVEQTLGRWKVKMPHLQPLRNRAAELFQSFSRSDFRHIPREQNREADVLANRAIDESSRGAHSR